MKKLAVLFFFGALALGVVAAVLLPFGRVFDLGKVKINWRGIEGSGNIVREARDVSEFESVEAGGAFLVEVKVGPAFAVEVEGDDNLIPLIETEVRGNTLHIEIDKGYHTQQKLKVHVTAPDLTRVGASGAANINVVGLNNDRFAIEASGGSRVTAAGKTNTVSVDISGGAKVAAGELAATNGNVDSSGGATAEVNVSNELNADASGGSRIYYAGAPTTLKKNSSGGAKISHK